MDELSNVIYFIAPMESPFFFFRKWAVMRLTSPGGSMRKQRRRKAKPIKVALASRAKRIAHEWRIEQLEKKQ